MFLNIIYSGEVYDHTLKAARTFIQERHARDARVRDAIRERDASDMNTAVLTIIAEGEERLTKWRQELSQGAPRTPERQREIVGVEEVVDLGIRAFASYVRKSLHAITDSHTIVLKKNMWPS
jgi:exportin-T